MIELRRALLALSVLAPLIGGCVDRESSETLPPKSPVAAAVPVQTSASPPAMVETVVSGGGSVVVQPHQTLYAVSRQTGVPLRALIDANGLKPPYHVHPGQTLIVPHIRQHIVQPGETLYAVSRRFGVEATTLARLNHLQRPYVIKRGTALILPPDVTVARNTVSAGPSASIAATPMPARELERQTTAVTSTGKRPGVIEATPLRPPSSGKATAAAPAPAKIAGGPVVPPAALPPLPTKNVASIDSQTSKLQDDGADTEDAGTTSAATPPASGAKTSLPPPSNVPPSGNVASAVRSHRAPTDPLFYWPARGKIIAVFGPTQGGTHNDGINIAAPEGTIVSAAESGVVAYAGDQLKGFGNLLLIKHDSGWVSAYAHNQLLLVNKGDRVRRGQPIARIGSTGGVSQPQLHFELREGVKAVDPLDHLPQLAVASG